MNETPMKVIVIGAGPIGLTTALLLARAGAQVVVLERDAAPPPVAGEGWTEWSRPGVNQFRQPHITLPRWQRVMSDELPEVVEALLALGGVRINLLHLHPAAMTGGWQARDERFDTVTARRPVLEAAIATVAGVEPRVQLLRGRRATGLLLEQRRVVGVHTAAGPLTAELVVDASGHRTPVPGWLRPYGLGPREQRSTEALTYYTRHSRAGSPAPAGTGAALTHHESYAVLTLPADDGCRGLAVIAGSADRSTRPLRHGAVWEAALRASGVDERWLEGQPLSDVQPLAGLQDIDRDYAPDGVPVIEGLVAVGDARATTSPFLGRGLSLGALSAVTLRDAVAESGSGTPNSGATPSSGGTPGSVAARYAELFGERVLPYVAATMGFGRHRLAEMRAQAAGEVYRSDDPAWMGGSALAAGARADPVLLRAHSMIASLLATPAEVFADPEIRARVGPWFGSPLCPPDRPGRAALLDAISRTSPPSQPDPSTNVFERTLT